LPPADTLFFQRTNSLDPAVIAEAWKFLKRLRWHLLLLVPCCLVVTFLHESAHALAVVWQGGEVTDFVVLPDGEHWGSMSSFVWWSPGFCWRRSNPDLAAIAAG
jgi:hypothetical protein